MNTILSRLETSWWRLAARHELRPAVVGGTPIEDFQPSQPKCHDCDFTNPSGELVLHHMWAEHGRDRRRRERRAAAA